MSHLVLLGDSVFDNAAYVRGGPSVIQHLRSKLPAGWRATLLAVDGSTTRDVQGQLDKIPPDAGRVIVSAGGNDALGHVGILSESARSAAEVLARLADIGEQFGQAYREMLRAVLANSLPTAVCTVYYPNFPEPALQRVATAALTIFNDVIIREAFEAGVPLIDLRLVCSEAGDYANEIEPSAAGGEKIATAILELFGEHDFGRGRTEVFK
ncbi:MAG TPA: SGNH/GDSL hydrolase family protein [Pyrinomonadaceae bacterium]|jgi:lysophospholipase L1-like esterase